MPRTKLSDLEAKQILLKWPNFTSLWPRVGADGNWIKGQPKKTGDSPGPKLLSPGARLFSTQPDGMWIHFIDEYSCDIIVIEVCGTIQNFNDKRSRYTPASHSIILSIGLRWLREDVNVRGGRRRARWKVVSIFKNEPKVELKIPVRHLRVLYSLPNNIYDSWCSQIVPAAYEYFCAHSSLNSYSSQTMQDFLYQLSPASQFYTTPKTITS